MAAHPPAVHRDLKRGDKGEDAKRLQNAAAQRLSERGQPDHYMPGARDGVVGSRTLDAVTRAAWILGVTEETHHNLKHGLIGEPIQVLIRHPNVRSDRQRKRGHERMEAWRDRKKQEAKAHRGIGVCTRAARLALAHAPEVHYTQGPSRWQGIAERLDASKGQFPRYADCSSFYTWCLWQLLKDGPDVVNGADWRAGYTGTLLAHGRTVYEPFEGAAVIYGTGFPGAHVAYAIGGGMVISHGSEGAPYLVPFNYRSDVLDIRAYV